MRAPAFFIRLSLIFVLTFILVGCGEDTIVDPPPPPEPPINIFGAPASLTSGIDMMLMWTDPASGITGSYNIYRKIGSGAVEKLNTTALVATSFGTETYYPKTLWFADTTYDTASSLTHIYFVRAENASGESAPSDSVVCVPNTIDPNNNPFANLSPDNEETSRITSFSWDPKAEATSYLLMLVNDQSYHNYWPWWIYRGTAAACDINSVSGTTYLDAVIDSLEAEHEYSWILWAVNADNCGITKAMADFKTMDPEFLITFVNGGMDAGRYRICWDQIGLDGRQVMPGAYTIHMTAGDFNTSIPFNIVTPGTPVGPVVAQDCDEDFSGLLPASYTLNLNGMAYAIGDTVKITYDMPVATNVRIDIDR